MRWTGVCELQVSACGMIEAATPAAAALLDFDVRALPGQLLVEHFDAASRAHLRESWQQWAQLGDADAGDSAWRGDLTVVRADGSSVPCCATARAAAGDGPARVVLALGPLVRKPLRDTTPRPQSLHDVLTGLPNRRGAREVVHAAVSMAAHAGDAISVACVDLDNFRSVNEDHGHDVAETVLRHVGDLLSRNTQGRARVCRTAGDEFLLVARGPDSPDLMRQLVPELLRRVREPIDIAGETVIVTASAGIVSCECGGTDFDALMQRASQAMSRAKRLGRNTWFLATARPGDCVQQQAIKTRLYRALQHEGLRLHYQPIIDLRSGRACAFEALMRWRDDTLGDVSPAVFIPLAEESGLIAALGAWTLEHACAQSAQWRRQAARVLPIAINVSVLQLQHGDFVQDLQQALHRHALPPGALELEVTESALIHDAEQLAGMSARLRALGVHVAIDDFGTGYSNLLYLKHLHPTRIKIDRVFIRRITDSPQDLAIVRGVIDMAHAIGARVVAEGVETIEAFAALRALGCDEAQGYHFARPAPAGQAARWLRDGTLPAWPEVAPA